MAVTSQIMAHTPLTGTGLSIPTATKKRNIAKWVEAKENRAPRFTDWMKRGEAVDQIDIETGQSYAPFIATTLGGATTAAWQNITVASSALIRVGDQVADRRLLLRLHHRVRRHQLPSG